VSTAPATVEFDHHSRETSYDRASVLARVREAPPVFWTEAHGGHWVVTSFELTKRVLKDAEVFSSLKHDDGSYGVTIPTAPGPRLIPAEADGQYHRRLRGVLAPKFNKPAVERLRPQVEAFVAETIDRVIEKRDFDVVHDVADVIPAGVVVGQLGFPDEERVPFIKSIQAALTTLSLFTPGDEITPEVQAGMDAFGHAVETIKTHIERRKREPADDLTSYLVQPEHELSDDDLLWLAFTLIVGGAENPAALISNTFLQLYENDQLRERLIAEPELIPKAAEELARDISPGVSLTRNVVSDVELGGQQLRPGERVLLWLPGGNHDDAVFTDPDSIDLDRPSCPHLAYGDGPHFCIGATLARLEYIALLEQALTRMPNFSIDLDRCERFEDAATMYGFRTMPATTNA
jgi:cytochrome P450